jgi:transcription elongation factor B subunit 1
MSQYIKLISSDNFQFYITKEAAEVSMTLKNMINSDFKESTEKVITLAEINGNLLNKIVEYLYYNLKYRDSVDVPEFEIPTEMSLELLVASDYLAV